MVGAFSLVGTSVGFDAATACPCLCRDALSPCNPASNGDFVVSKKQSSSSLVLGSSFLGSAKPIRGESLMVKGQKKKKKKTNRRGLVVVNEVAGQYEDGFEDVKTAILNYFTYKAVRTVMHQLYEMNPQQYRWLYDFVVSNNPGDGKVFLRKLGKERHQLAERVMVTRLHLYGKWVKKCNHEEMYKQISDQNLELMRERLLETVVWPSDDTNSEMIS